MWEQKEDSEELAWKEWREREVASELGGEGGARGLSEGFVGLCGLEPGKKGYWNRQLGATHGFLEYSFSTVAKVEDRL